MALETTTVEGVEVFAAGGPYNGTDFYSESDLDEMIRAFESGQLGFTPQIKIGHQDGQESRREQLFDAPSLGYVSRLYRRGKKLIADFAGVPRKFKELWQAGAWGRDGRISSEVFWSYQDPGGHTWSRVLRAVSLLGADSLPAVGTLGDVAALYVQGRSPTFQYDERGRSYKTYSFDFRAQEKRLTYSIKKIGSEFHVLTASGLMMGRHDDLIAAERQRRELSK